MGFSLRDVSWFDVQLVTAIVGCVLLSSPVKSAVTPFPASVTPGSISPGQIITSPNFMDGDHQTAVSDFAFTIYRTEGQWTCLYVGYIDLKPSDHRLMVTYGSSQDNLVATGDICYSEDPVYLYYANSAPYTGTGFYITTASVNNSVDHHLEEPNGFIRWKDYDSDTSRKWSLGAQNGNNITLEFSEFRLNNNVDYLKIYDDTDESETPIHLLTGTLPNGHRLVLPYKSITLVASSSINSANREGFILAYYRAEMPMDDDENRHKGFRSWWIFGLFGGMSGMIIGIVRCHYMKKHKKNCKVHGRSGAGGTFGARSTGPQTTALSASHTTTAAPPYTVQSYSAGTANEMKPPATKPSELDVNYAAQSTFAPPPTVAQPPAYSTIFQAQTQPVNGTQTQPANAYGNAYATSDGSGI